MTSANSSTGRPAKLLVVDRDGRMRHLPRATLGSCFGARDLVVANDAATLPASLKGIHCPSGNLIEVRLAAWESVHDATQFTAVVFGAGDHRTRTEDRRSPPALSLGDRLSLGPLVGIVEGLLDVARTTTTWPRIGRTSKRIAYKVEKWTKDGSKVDRLLYASNSVDKARGIFERTITHRLRIRLTIWQRTRYWSSGRRRRAAKGAPALGTLGKRTIWDGKRRSGQINSKKAGEQNQR